MLGAHPSPCLFLFTFQKSARWKIFHHSTPYIVECVSEYIFIFKKQTSKHKKTRIQMKAKESKEEKIIYLENALKNKFAATWVKILFVTSFLETSIFFLLAWRWSSPVTWWFIFIPCLYVHICTYALYIHITIYYTSKYCMHDSLFFSEDTVRYFILECYMHGSFVESTDVH